MGKKRKTQVFVLKPWCWYCEREFEDDKVLLQHQKSKHFKCQLCPRKLNTAGGLMVHSQQVHKCDPEPLTNTLSGRDGYDIEIFGMEGVPTNALAEWKARKEAEAGSAALAAASAARRPRNSYPVIPEADLMTALSQHKMLMATRNNPIRQMAFPPFPPGSAPPFAPGMPPPTFPSGFPMPPPTLPPGLSAPGLAAHPSFTLPFPPPGNPSLGPGSARSPLPPFNAHGSISSPLAGQAPPSFVPQGGGQQPTQDPSTLIPIPKDGVLWPDATASPAEKRAQQNRYRYTSPFLEVNVQESGSGDMGGRKRKAAADFI